MTESELYHHGIKGQKWGVRRYQNPDGSLTAAGKKHVGLSTSGVKGHGTDLTKLGSSGGGGGGGGALEDEDQKKLEEMWEEMAEIDGYEFPDPNDSEFLAELGEAGIDTGKLSKEQIQAAYDKAKDTYEKAKGGSSQTRSMGNSNTIAYDPDKEAQKAHDEERQKTDAEELKRRKENNRPKARTKYITDATGSLKKRDVYTGGRANSAKHSYEVPSVSELYHHGIKGQKWGVRRFQNEDGTLTEAGKRRDARQIQKDLNSLDNKWAHAELKRQRAQRELNSVSKKFDKSIDKAEKKGDIEEAKKKLSEAHDKAMKPANKYNDAMRSIESIEAQQWKKIGEAAMKKYDVTTKPVYRYGSEGAKAARLFGALGMLSYGAATGDTGVVAGTKFKVKNPKRKE